MKQKKTPSRKGAFLTLSALRRGILLRVAQKWLIEALNEFWTICRDEQAV